MTLSLAEARTLIDNATQKAAEIGARCAIAVLDAGGRVVSVDQLDGAHLHRDRMAKGKALAALVLGYDTREGLEMYETTPTRFFGLLGILPGEIYMNEGGVLLKTRGEIVGAIGIAGGKMGADEVMAAVGIAAWREAFDKPE